MIYLYLICSCLTLEGPWFTLVIIKLQCYFIIITNIYAGSTFYTAVVQFATDKSIATQIIWRRYDTIFVIFYISFFPLDRRLIWWDWSIFHNENYCHISCFANTDQNLEISPVIRNWIFSYETPFRILSILKSTTMLCSLYISPSLSSLFLSLPPPFYFVDGISKDHYNKEDHN